MLKFRRPPSQRGPRNWTFKASALARSSPLLPCGTVCFFFLSCLVDNVLNFAPPIAPSPTPSQTLIVPYCLSFLFHFNSSTLILYRSLALYSSRHFFAVYFIISELEAAKRKLQKKTLQHAATFFFSGKKFAEKCVGPPISSSSINLFSFNVWACGYLHLIMCWFFSVLKKMIETSKELKQNKKKQLSMRVGVGGRFKTK